MPKNDGRWTRKRQNYGEDSEMKLVVNLSEKELRKKKHIIGEAFVTNELFHEFGGIAERRPLRIL